MRLVVLGAMLVSAGFAQTGKPVFEVASVKETRTGGSPRGIRAMPGGQMLFTSHTLKNLVQWAYNLQEFQISGGPKWADTVTYDIDAKPEHAITPSPETIGIEREMMQALLRERFQLSILRSTKEMPVYALVQAKRGAILTERGKPENPYEMGVRGGQGRIDGLRAPMSLVVRYLAVLMGRLVNDETGLPGYYDFKVEWTPDGTDGSGPSISTALQEQLGLKLEPRKAPVEMFYIDRAEKPSEN